MKNIMKDRLNEVREGIEAFNTPWIYFSPVTAKNEFEERWDDEEQRHDWEEYQKERENLLQKEAYENERIEEWAWNWEDEDVLHS